jgi:serine/threonine protein kinase
MITERSQRVEALFASAVELEPGRRAAFLDAECANDPALRAEVESLLAADERAGHFIEEPVLEIMAAAQSNEPAESESEPEHGRCMGPYRLIREIGHGGMGEVYLAARADDQYHKQVAIKLVRRGMDTDAIIRRFRHERQILASLDHPNIARLLDGGATDDGLPWLALEYIAGEPIDAYCDRNRLSITEQLRLFREVCAAVHYAHQNLVIHRDLKPSNILVTANGAPKLLDFGIAKILNPELRGQTADQTLSVMRLMTPSYASPEQVKGETITTASDVYSLGVILYELLTGHRPYHITNNLPHEIERIICEVEPTRPSLVVTRPETVTNEGAKATITPEEVSRARNDQPERLRRRLAGDLDNIVLMALRKGPQRRYSSVEQFSEDIRRHLDGLPVTASRDTFAYRSAKFVGRNKTLVTTATLAVLLLVGVTILALWWAALARRESNKAQSVNGFLWRLVHHANPNHDGDGHGKGPDVTLLDAIRSLENQIDSDFSNQPDVRLDLHHMLGQMWYLRGEYDSAEPHLRSTMELARQIQGESHPRFIQNLYKLGLIAEQRNGNNTRSIEMIRRSVEMMRLYEPENGALPYMLSDLGEVLGYEGIYGEAEQVTIQAREMLLKIMGNEDNLPVAFISYRLGKIYLGKGEIERAEAHFRDHLERLRRIPNAKQEAGEPTYLLGVIDYTRGNYSEAEKSLGEAERLYNHYLGRNFPLIAEILYYLSSIHCLQENYPLAEAEARRALQINRLHRPDHPITVTSIGLLSKVLIRAGRPTQAVPYLHEVMEKLKAAPVRTNRKWFASASILGECLTLLKRYDEAERFLNGVYTNSRPNCSEKSPEMVEACQRLVKLYEAWGKPEQAARYRN